MEPRDLYGMPLERFTEERNALAGELRREARRDEAAFVSKLRKPSLAAWAVNQLVRSQRSEISVLYESGDALQRAQAELLGGRGDATMLREAVDRERGAVKRLTETARGLLSSEGHELSPAKLEQVSETLHAAALDTDARARVQEGCLERELRHIGIGALEVISTPRSATAERPRGSATAERRRGTRVRARLANPRYS